MSKTMSFRVAFGVQDEFLSKFLIFLRKIVIRSPRSHFQLFHNFSQSFHKILQNLWKVVKIDMAYLSALWWKMTPLFTQKSLKSLSDHENFMKFHVFVENHYQESLVVFHSFTKFSQSLWKVLKSLFWPEPSFDL